MRRLLNFISYNLIVKLINFILTTCLNYRFRSPQLYMFTLAIIIQLSSEIIVCMFVCFFHYYLITMYSKVVYDFVYQYRF